VLKVYESDVKDVGEWYELSQTREWDNGGMGNEGSNAKMKRKSMMDVSNVKTGK
jgi:hypothetical protein